MLASRRGQQRRRFAQAPPNGRRPVVTVPTAASEEIAPHQRLHRLGQLHSAVRRLVIFEQRNEDPWGGQAVLLSVCANRTLPSLPR